MEDTKSIVSNDGFEKIQYDRDDFPVLIRKNVLERNTVFHNVQKHWHHDLEFIAVVEGSVKYNVNGEIIRMQAGQGIFVNAQQIHYIVSDDGAYVTLYCVVIHPMLLCPVYCMEREYVKPVTENTNVPFLFLDNSIDWQNDILRCIEALYEETREKTPELKVVQLFARMWELLYNNMEKMKKHVPSSSQHLSDLKNMMMYVHANYREKITLDDICVAGNVGKTTCTTLFKKYVGVTPNAFLIDVRLEKAAILLRESDMNITEIAYETGFSGGSYFSEAFKQKFGCSPREFRV